MKPAPDKKVKVFISYSRAEVAFADELVAGLEFEGQFEVTIDRHSIIEGEEWNAHRPLPYSTLCPLANAVRAAGDEYLKLNLPAAEPCQ